jgi:hypothetical protein
MTIYDPPSGHRYGFPKEYKPLDGETLAQTLRRDGYPQKEIDWGGDKYVRFWEHKEEPAEFCIYCGAGVGKFRRDGEGTCPKCDENKNG